MVHAAAMTGRTRVPISVWGKTAGALVALLFLIPVGAVGTAPLIFGAMVAILSAVSPRSTLLWLAALFPLAAIALPVLLTWPASVADAIVVAFLAGACFRSAREGSVPGTRPFAFALVAVIAAVIASLVVQTALAGVLVTPAGIPEHLAAAWLTLYERPEVMPSAIAAVQMVTALGVSGFAAAWTADPTFRAKLLRVSIAGGSGAALLSVARVTQVAIRGDGILAAMPRILGSIRVNGPFSDPNAAGSYFLLLLVPAAMAALKPRGKRRARWLIPTALLAVGVWTSGSRAAVLVGLACLGTATIVAAFQSRRWRYPILAAVVAASGAAVWLFPNPIISSSVTSAVGIRAEMARVAVRMWKTDPWIGVGIGTFYDRSGEFVRDPFVKSLYGRENAHNNFLQILAELGVLGTAAFGLLIWAAAPPIRDQDGISLGVAAFLATCLAGHPLLLPAVALPFWILVGACAGRNAIHHRARGWLTCSLVVAMTLAMAPSFKVERAAMNLEHAGGGLSAWQSAGDGTRFRQMRGHARVFAPREAGQVTFAVRAAKGADVPVTLSISLEGQPADRLILTHDWTIERLRMPDDPPYEFMTLDLVGTDPAREPASVDVGKVEPAGFR